jgi:hypothetical protein
VEPFTEIEELSRCLNEMGVPMDETMVVTKIVSSLSDDKFHAFKKAWDSVPEASPTMPMLMGRLRKEELESKPFHETQSSEAVHQKANAFLTNATGKNNGKKGKQSIEERKKSSTCNNCGKKGHWWKECLSAKKSETGKPIPVNEKESKTHAFMIHAFHLSDEASSS